MQRNLLLVSNSKQHDTGYLDHVEEALNELLGNCKTLLFIPYALHDWDGYAAVVTERFQKLGITVGAIHKAKDPVDAIRQAEALFIGGGNTFRLLNALYKYNLLEPIRKKVAAGMPYMGSSAGSNMACPTIKTTNDMPIIYPPSFDALNLIPFQINPHYIDADPGSKHMGETREQRLKEFHEENETPVVGLREGMWIRVIDDSIKLGGEGKAKIFLKGQDPKAYDVSSNVSFLLKPAA